MVTVRRSLGSAPLNTRASSRSAGTAGRSRPERNAFALVVALWVVTLFEPQQWLASKGIGAALKIQVVLFLALGATMALGVPSVKAWARRWTWYMPLLTLTGLAILGVPFAANTGRAYDEAQALLLWYVLVVGSTVFANTARRVETLLYIYALQFLVFGALGGFSGSIGWHTVLSNDDAFGAFMVVGGGLCGMLLAATRRRWFRWAMGAAVGLCAVGLVASFARGALLAGIAVAGLVWLRSPRKGVALVAGVVSAGIVVAAAALLYSDAYWAEMQTILQGTSEATGEDRAILWGAATQVFLHYPIFGTGLGNWGVVASEMFQPGDLGGRYAFNPEVLYTRDLHSSYFKILAEQGLAGVGAFLWLLVDFWRRNMALRTEAAQQRWAALGGTLRLRNLAYGLEAAMFGWLCCAALYSMAGSHWIYTILALNLMFHVLIRQGAPRSAPLARRRGVATAAPAPHFPVP